MHALQKFFAQPVNHVVVRAHPLLHNFRRHANHVRVANVAPLDDSHDIFARAQLAGHRLHAQNSSIGTPQRIQHLLRRAFQRPRRQILEQKAFADSIALFQCRREASRHCLARKIGNQRNALASAESRDKSQ